MDALRARPAELAAVDWKHVKVVLPYSCALRATDYGEAGIEIEADVPPDLAHELTHRRFR